MAPKIEQGMKSQRSKRHDLTRGVALFFGGIIAKEFRNFVCGAWLLPNCFKLEAGSNVTNERSPYYELGSEYRWDHRIVFLMLRTRFLCVESGF
jgi:hypothetical protein